jgi:RNA polymerase sigma factor (sigma-70 family)
MRRFHDLGAAEDAVQEALLAAALQWPRDGVPGNPRGWLIQVALRRITDFVRSEDARRRREAVAAAAEPDFLESETASETDDALTLFFMCCHPALTPSSAIALTLRAVGGLSTAAIASAFLVPEPTMAQRISRAKQTIKASGVPFELPARHELEQRLRLVLHVLYLMFNEGYTTRAGAHLQCVELSDEAIRLTRSVDASLPRDPEVAGLLALMLLTDARKNARSGRYGELIPLLEQDRTAWNRSPREWRY